MDEVSPGEEEATAMDILKGKDLKGESCMYARPTAKILISFHSCCEGRGFYEEGWDGRQIGYQWDDAILGYPRFQKSQRIDQKEGGPRRRCGNIQRCQEAHNKAQRYET